MDADFLARQNWTSRERRRIWRLTRKFYEVGMHRAAARDHACNVVFTERGTAALRIENPNYHPIAGSR